MMTSVEILSSLRFVAKYLLGLDKANRYFKVYPDDTFVISYPRSGSTWSRFLIANLVYPKDAITFANLDEFVPATASVSRRRLDQVARPRIIKCHNYFDHRYQRVIYIVRDPRDVVLSEYRFLLKKRLIADGYPMELFVQRFLRGEVNEYSSWKENVGSWTAARGGDDGFLLLRYEDIAAQTEVELAKVARFLRIEASTDDLMLAVTRSSADHMRSLESKQSDLWIVTKGSRRDVPFVGNAQAGQWKSLLSSESVAAIEQAWGRLMVDLGYVLAADQPSQIREPFAVTSAIS
jgi:hypothetical protein